jgi:hypothetical protein
VSVGAASFSAVDEQDARRITPRQFHESAGVEDWRVVFTGVCAHFRAGSFASGVALVDAIGRLAAGPASPTRTPATLTPGTPILTPGSTCGLEA